MGEPGGWCAALRMGCGGRRRLRAWHSQSAADQHRTGHVSCRSTNPRPYAHRIVGCQAGVQHAAPLRRWMTASASPVTLTLGELIAVGAAGGFGMGVSFFVSIDYAPL